MSGDRWSDEANCAGVGDYLFFPDGPAPQVAYRQAKPVCDVCPVWKFCRLASIGERDGFWAGVAPATRAKARSAMGVALDPDFPAAVSHRLADQAYALRLEPEAVAAGWLGERRARLWMDYEYPNRVWFGEERVRDGAA